VVGEKLYALWEQASANLAETLAKLAPQFKALGSWLLSTAAGAGFAILQFLIAIVIAGVMLANSEAGGRATRAVARRLAGDQGEGFARLAEATVRSVARGILGVALIQFLLIALGFVVMDIPGAGLWALLCLILSVIQIGPFPVVLPVLIYAFSTSDTVPAVLFLIWNLFAGSVDNVLKPVLLGRGVEVPMAVIFVGAIGGFISSGIIGLFVGAVVLVLGYKLFLAWLGEAPEPASSPPAGEGSRARDDG
jgi:predicted PurR-regulated permease PerM